jgi:hypothetical protein
MGTEGGMVDPASVGMDLHDGRWMEVLVARRRTYGHVMMLFCQRRLGRG